MNNFKFTWRYFKLNKSYTLINVVGMTIALTSAMLLFSYVGFHFSFNRFHDDSERMYRILSVDETAGGFAEGSQNANALIPAMRSEIPEIEEATRFYLAIGVTIRLEDQIHTLGRAYFAESGFFEYFNFPLLAGEPGNVLNEPNTAVISATYARQLFGDEDPVGRVLRLFDNRSFRITGIAEDMPANSHLQMELILSALPDPAWGEQARQYLDSWERFTMQSYVKLHAGSSLEEVEAKVNAIIDNNQNTPGFSARLQPLHDVHLRSGHITFEVNDNKEELQTMIVFLTVAVLLLVAAICNFVNLSTARAIKRAREVGIRKVSGATRWQLTTQFVGESFTLVMTSAVLSLVLVEAVYSITSLSIGDSFLSFLLTNPIWFLLALGGIALVALLAGFYPAVVLSSYEVTNVLRDSVAGSPRGSLLRKLMVVTQFTISIAIIIGLIVAYNQLQYMRTKSLGFDPSNIVVTYFGDSSQLDQYSVFANQLDRTVGIESYTTTGAIPGLDGYGRTGFLPVEAPESSNESFVNFSTIDHRFVETMGMNILQGLNFHPESTNNLENPVLVNQSAALFFQWQGDPVGRQLRASDGTVYTVSGVVEDFHTSTMRFVIEPLVLRYSDEANWGHAIKVDTDDAAAALDKIRAAWNTAFPGYPFIYHIYTEEIESLTGEEQDFTNLLLQFAFIAILIACLGLYGLAAFSASQRTKEIGIRKIYGAPVLRIVNLFLKEYSILILVAMVVAWPIAYYTMNSWLSDFAYRTELSIWGFIQASLLAATIGLLTVSNHLWHVVRANPIDALRYE